MGLGHFIAWDNNPRYSRRGEDGRLVWYDEACTPEWTSMPVTTFQQISRPKPLCSLVSPAVADALWLAAQVPTL